MAEVAERKISPAIVIIPIGLGLVAVVGLAAMAWAAPPPEEFVCPHCGATFATYEELVAHIQAVHPPEGPAPQTRDEWDANSRLCPYCGQVYASYAILLEHIHIVHPGYPDPVEVPIF